MQKVNSNSFEEIPKHSRSDKKTILIIFSIVFGTFVLFLGGSILVYKNLVTTVEENTGADTTLGEYLKKKFNEYFTDTGNFSTKSDYNNSVSDKPVSTGQSSVSSTYSDSINYNFSYQSSPSNKNICYRYTISEGEFKSNKCYSPEEYRSLQSALFNYNLAISSKIGAEATISFACNGGDFFEKSCENAKKQKEKAENDIEKYKKEVNNIIAQGE